ncbi:MAG TPA: 3-phosphoshikimate 1-carboxyvinyltransferase, partial [Thermoanaerobacterales bacterium]|nr:3-phosphoshikimate 1-carboxyvinyltransferase [Thermoanaerobacterales bacterium]
KFSLVLSILTLCGNLTPGKYKIRGDVSSQFITGLMFALPLLGGDSRIVITTPLESKGYIDLTISALKDCSITIENKNYKEFFIKGGQRYRPTDYYVEGDFSQSAFWLGAGALGADIICENINNKTFQGDKAILEIISNMGGSLEYGENSIAGKGPLIVYDEITIDVSQCPDLAPVIAVLGSLRKGRTKIVNAKRLRLKESDRLKALSEGLGKIGAKIEELPDSLVIEGQETLEGGIVDSNGDHRIVMALAIASMRCKNPVIIKNSDAVNKSYPGFWNDFVKLGGEIFEFDYR